MLSFVLIVYGLILYVFLLFLIHFNNLYKTLARKKRVPYRIGAVIEYLIVYWPLVIVTAIFSLVCKFIVKTILKYYYGKEIICFLNGQDSLYIDKHPHQAMVPILFLIQDSGLGFKINRYLFNCVLNLKCTKVYGTLESWNGYHYIKSGVLDNYITKLRVVPNQEVLNRDDLLNLTEELYLEFLSQPNKALWQMYIGTQPVNWSTSQNGALFPIVVLFSHCFFDEANFIKTLLRVFGDEKLFKTVNSNPVTLTSSIWSKISSLFKIGFKKVHEVYQFCKYSYKGLPLTIVNSDLLQFKRNVLVGAELGNRKFFCVGRNDAALALSRANIFGNQYNFETTLSCIFETAIIASLSEFYQNYSYTKYKREQNLIYVTTMIDKCHCLTQQETEDILDELSETTINEVRFMCLNSPILESISLKKPADLVSLLEHITSQKDFLRRYEEPEITQNVSSGVYNDFPKFLQKLILSHQISPQTMVSQFRGPSSEIRVNNVVVEDIYGWCPNFGKTGLTFSICSYKNVPHITLNADANLIGSKADAQALLDGVYRYFDILMNYSRNSDLL